MCLKDFTKQQNFTRQILFCVFLQVDNVYAFHKDVDDQTRANSDTPLAPDRDATTFITQRMLLRQEIQWTVTVKNLGPGDSSSFYVSFDDDENPATNPINEQQVAGLSSGDPATVSFQRTAQSGEQLFFMVDSRREIDEADEGNVMAGPDLSDLLLPNLYIADVQHQPDKPGLFDSVTWSVLVRNDGPGNSEIFTVSLDDDDDPDDEDEAAMR